MKSEIKKSIDESVLCWLATSNKDGEPNVSPKEVFTHFEDKYIIIANVASPNSVKNIKTNPKVCVSFIDIFVQKGFQIKGRAHIVDNNGDEYVQMEELLLEITKGDYPFRQIIKIEIDRVKPIIAPKYILYPETTEKDQIASAMKTYGVTRNE